MLTQHTREYHGSPGGGRSQPPPSGLHVCTPVFPTLTILGCLRGMQGPLVLQTHAYPPKLRQLSRLKHRYLALEERPWHQPLKATYYLPTILVLYNTLDPDVALAYLPTATVTISVVGMIMSLVLDHEYKKLILRVLNLVHEVKFNENGKAWLKPIVLRLFWCP